MNNMADQTSSSSNSPKNSQGNQLTLKHALDLLNLKELPEGVDSLEFLTSTRILINRNSEDWIKQNRVRLVKELEILATM